MVHKQHLHRAVSAINGIVHILHQYMYTYTCTCTHYCCYVGRFKQLLASSKLPHLLTLSECLLYFQVGWNTHHMCGAVCCWSNVLACSLCQSPAGIPFAVLLCTLCMYRPMNHARIHVVLCSVSLVTLTVVRGVHDYIREVRLNLCPNCKIYSFSCKNRNADEKMHDTRV